MGGVGRETHAQKIVEMMDMALKSRDPVRRRSTTAAARASRRASTPSPGTARSSTTTSLLSGVVPQISVIAGPCAGGAAYSPALTDFIIMVQGIGPHVHHRARGDQAGRPARRSDAEELGGADTPRPSPAERHFVADDDEQAILIAKKLLSFLPQNNTEDAPMVDGDCSVDDDPRLHDIVPVDGKQGYDVRDVIAKLVDHGDFLEVQADYAPNIVVGFARINGRSVGIVANQPAVMAGVLDINASDKGSGSSGSATRSTSR